MHQVRVIITLVLLYLAMSSNLQPLNILLGVVLATGIVLLIRPRRRPTPLRQIPAMTLGLIIYTLVLAREIFLNGLDVARIVLSPSLPIAPGIIAVPSECQSDLCTALSALVITASPGEIVVEIGDDGTLYTHFLFAQVDDEEVYEAQRARRAYLERIFA
jgi:multicomponent Na+:H+ antiporter subunit E